MTFGLFYKIEENGKKVYFNEHVFRLQLRSKCYSLITTPLELLHGYYSRTCRQKHKSVIWFYKMHCITTNTSHVYWVRKSFWWTLPVQVGMYYVYSLIYSSLYFHYIKDNRQLLLFLLYAAIWDRYINYYFELRALFSCCFFESLPIQWEHVISL